MGNIIEGIQRKTAIKTGIGKLMNFSPRSLRLLKFPPSKYI